MGRGGFDEGRNCGVEGEGRKIWDIWSLRIKKEIFKFMRIEVKEERGK